MEIKCKKCGEKLETEDKGKNNFVKCSFCEALNHIKCRHKSGDIKKITLING